MWRILTGFADILECPVSDIQVNAVLVVLRTRTRLGGFFLARFVPGMTGSAEPMNDAEAGLWSMRPLGGDARECLADHGELGAVDEGDDARRDE